MGLILGLVMQLIAMGINVSEFQALSSEQQQEYIRDFDQDVNQ